MEKRDACLTARFREVMQGMGLGEGCPVLVAFSGGGDSVCLLSLLVEYGAHVLTAVHVNHGIRGQEAERDAAFCADFCETRGIAFRLVTLDVPSYAKAHRMGLEEGARVLRYEALEAVAREENIPFIALAHHATDQVETVLMHLTRGSGLRGLCGMAERSGKLIRPLLRFSRSEIEEYLAEKGLSFVTDSTNVDTAFTRNAIRHEVLSHLRQINPRIEDAVARMTETVRRDEDFLSRLAAEHGFDEGRTALCALDDAILSRVLRREYEVRFEGMLTGEQITAMCQAIRSQSTCVTLSLPGGCVFSLDRGIVRFAPLDEMQAGESETALKPGWQTFALGQGMILYRRGKLSREDEGKIGDLQKIYKLLSTMSLDSATISGTLRVRSRRAGDRYHDGVHTRDIRSLFRSKKIPLSLRASYPVIADDKGALALPGFPLKSGQIPPEREVTLVVFYPLDKRK